MFGILFWPGKLMDWKAHWRHAARKKGTGFQPELAMEFRAYVGDTLDQWRPDWESLPNAEVAIWLVAAKILTFTGARFDQDRVRDFKRSLSKNDPRASTAIKRQESEAIADLARIRAQLLAIIPELDEAVTAKRADEIKRMLDGLTLRLFCEDRFASQVDLQRAVEVAVRKFEKRYSKPLFD